MSEDTSSSTTARPDANRIALRALRALLDAAAPFTLTVEGTVIDVQIERLPVAPWPPRGLIGLDPEVDGPLPRAIRARCTWPNGSTELLVRADWWRTQSAYRHLFGLKCTVAATGQEIGWTSVALALQHAKDGDAVRIWMSISPFRRKDEDAEEVLQRRSYPLKAAVERSGIPLVTQWRAEICSVQMPDGQVAPSPEEGFRRAIHLTLLKLPFFVRDDKEGYIGAPPFAVNVPVTPPPVSERDSESPPASKPASTKRAGIVPLPGGVRQFKQTLDEILEHLGDGPQVEEDFFAMLRDRYEVNGPTARTGYTNLLLSLGFVQYQEGAYSLTSDGQIYSMAPAPKALFERLHREYTGMLELLVMTDTLGNLDTSRANELLPKLLGNVWKTSNQTSFRRNWLLSIGATERLDDGDVLTDFGHQLLRDHESEIGPIRERLDELVAERGLGSSSPGSGEEGEEEDETGNTTSDTSGAAPIPATAPSAWDAARLDLRGEQAAAQTTGLELPPSLLDQACAALSAGKHLLLIGPPGTGKTELALALAQTARNDGYCAGAFVATASADWTTFDTIGGYALQRDSSLTFRPGVFLRALERWQWLVLDELNRADVDRAFGELMTVLAGRGTDTPMVDEKGDLVSIGPEAGRTHRVPRTFRVIATMNTWDKTSLFRLSYAVQRRFAVIHVGIPNDDAYARLIESHATQKGLDAPLPEGAVGPLQRLFRQSGLFAHRPIGPAVTLDIIRYMRRRQASGDGLAEAIAMYLLPQLEGLEQEPAARALDVLIASLEGWTSAEAIATLRRRYEEIFPHLDFRAS